MPTKEEIYDEEISPLMSQIIGICKTHKIANICSFSLDLDEGLCCTTAMVSDEFAPPGKFIECINILNPQNTPSPMLLTVTDENGIVKEIHSILAEKGGE